MPVAHTPTGLLFSPDSQSKVGASNGALYETPNRSIWGAYNKACSNELHIIELLNCRYQASVFKPSKLKKTEVSFVQAIRQINQFLASSATYRYFIISNHHNTQQNTNIFAE